MRWGQINIRETEPPEFDVSWWERYWQRIHLDGITLNAGGLVAYYPTELADHHRSRWLGDRDLFGELLAAAKRCGIRVLARIDPGESYADVYYRHPSWFAVDADHRPMREYGDQELYVPCMNGPYYREFIPNVIREIYDRYDVDGIFCSEWDGRRRVCHCQTCSRLFRDETGLALPAGSQQATIASYLPVPTSPEGTGDNMAWKRWLRWHEAQLRGLWRYWDDVCRTQRPDTFFMGNKSERAFLADEAVMINVDNQSRQHDKPLWHVGEQGKRMRAITGGQTPYFHIFSSNSYSRHVAKPEAEYRLYMADAVLADSRPWFTMIGGVQDDRRQFGPLEQFYAWHHDNQAALTNRESLAEVAIVFDDRDRFLPADRGGTRSFDGMYYALLRSRVPFDLVHAQRMRPEIVSRYKVLVLPNVVCLSKSEIEDLRRFVGSGGSLVATYETGTRDEWGRLQVSTELDNLLGLESRSPSLGPLQHSMARLHDRSPVLDGLEGTSIVLNSRYVCPVVPRPGSAAEALTMVPPYTVYPPERSFSSTGDSRLPLLVTSQHEDSGSRIVYWPGDIDASVHESNSPDHLRMLRNSVQWAHGGKPLLEVDTHGLLDVHPYRQQDDVQLHLVNLTSPDAWKAPAHNLHPLRDVTLRLRADEGHDYREKARALVAGRDLAVRRTGDWFTVVVDELIDHEIVVLSPSLEDRR